jgi:enediyne biosynthesis protein E4
MAQVLRALFHIFVGFSLLAAVGVVVGCGGHALTEPVDDAPPWFVDVTEESGLNFVHEAGSRALESYFLPHLIGSGAALFDYDGDGKLDIYLIQNGGPDSKATNRLYHQEPDGRFKDVSAGSGLDVIGHGMGVAIGDVNNDGRPDVLVTEFGAIRLFLNNGDGTFTEATREAGLDHPFWATSAAFVDYDRDGWLDLVVVNYVDYDPTKTCWSSGAQQPDYCNPKVFPGAVAKLYHNRGPIPGSKTGAVRFEDVTLASGLGKLPGPGLGVVCADFDGDGWPDIFVANDAHPNHLWINQHDGTFKEEAVRRGLAYNAMGQTQGNMGIALGDVENHGDGRFDVFVTHLTEESHTLWSQKPRGFFSDQTAAAGLANPRWRGTGFGAVMGDFNQDGALDVAVVNGRVSRGQAPENSNLPQFWQRYAERNQLFANDGAGSLRDISTSNGAFCGRHEVARGLACGDLNGDGALDLLVTTIGGPAHIFRNVAPNRGHWLLVRAIDPALGGRDAYGAQVTVEAGAKRWVRWINPGQSFLSSNDPRAHFGLGKTETISALHVVWPNGDKESFEGCAVDQPVLLKKGEGRK